MTELEEKIKEFYPKMVVLKGKCENTFSNLSIPGYIKDWFLMRYADNNGNIDETFLIDKIKTILPIKDNWNIFLERIVAGKEEVKILAKIKIKLSISDDEIYFSLPDMDLDYDETIIEKHVWDKIKSSNVSLIEDTWGILTLKLIPYKKKNKISLANFQAFQPYKVDLDYYSENRKQFNIDEWLDILLGAINYKGASYKTIENKLEMIKRLIPFVEKRVNLIELAPKGTGKSFVFSQISKYGWLNSGGVVTRAKLFYDMHSKQLGLIGNYDFVALDEISTIKFSDVSEMQGSLKGYLESGTFAVGTKKNQSDAGMIFLGNIRSNKMSEDANMFSELPVLFNDSALLDRIHGFVKGWDIPRMDESMKMSGWALNTEYFSTIMHLLRDESIYDSLVDSLLIVESGDTRDVTAVKRITSGLIKLLFPNWKSIDDVNKDEFEEYCLNPAINMRKIIKKQLCILDEEYKKIQMPSFSINM
ncbi:MAG: BREX system Lon protease-like protein BrxL [Acholeplasmatales bacterium]|nr:BREX system Lon protease-like protein BrxL [Acholeplasmatales bacterium]